MSHVKMEIITAVNTTIHLVQCLDSDSGQYQLLERKVQEASKEGEDLSWKNLIS